MTRARETSRFINPVSRLINVPAVSQGGVVTEYESGGSTYRVHSFLSGTSKFVITSTKVVDFLIVGGGGGSAAAEGYSGSTGGAGAGGMVVGTTQTITAGEYEVVVGALGAKSTSISAPASNGGDSSFNSFVGKGGGAGSDYVGSDAERVGIAGGSGAGGSENNQTAGASNQPTYSGTTNVTGYGNAGGNGGAYNSGHGSGGGGGAGGVGTQYQAATANGGVGLANNFRTGSDVTYARGGNGYAANESSVDEAANTGNGAHGVSTNSGGNTNSGNGGSGIVVIRYVV